MEITSGAIFVMLAFVGLLAMLYVQQRTIDKLTDKLMAKDYNEYKRHREPFQDTNDAPKPRKPMSFYDDPNVELEDDGVN